MEERANTFHLPAVNKISISAPFGWLKEAWSDMRRALVPTLFYGFVMAAISAGFAAMMFLSGAGKSLLALLAGFLLVAPLMAMGLYQAGRMLENGRIPSVPDILFVKRAVRKDIAFLGVALVVIYSLWVEVALLNYGLATYQVHKTFGEFLTFMFTDPAGHRMALIGTLLGGVIAFIAFSLVVISAPMLLNENQDVFIATITSVRTVVTNFVPMLVWAFLIVGLTLIGIATGFVGLIVTFPLIGLASWRAYRELVPSSDADLLPVP